MEVRLVVQRGRSNSSDILLRKFPVVVGRRVECNLRITSPMVSRNHCIFETEDGWFIVRDLQSSNGTFVNGRQIDSSTIVKPGDVLEIGPITFQVAYEAPVAAAVKGGAGPASAPLAIDDLEVDSPPFELDSSDDAFPPVGNDDSTIYDQRRREEEDHFDPDNPFAD